MMNDFKLLKGYTSQMVLLIISLEELNRTLEKWNESLIRMNESLESISTTIRKN